MTNDEMLEALKDFVATTVLKATADLPAMSQTLDRIQVKLGTVDGRLHSVERQLSDVDGRLSGVDQKLTSVGAKLDELALKVDTIADAHAEDIDGLDRRLGQLEHRAA